MPECNDGIGSMLNRRHFLQVGSVCLAGASLPFSINADENVASELHKWIEQLDPFFTPQEKFSEVSRGKPLPHSLPDEKKASVGLTRESWRLEVVGDPNHPPSLAKQLTIKDGSALDFQALLRLGEKHSVRFAKVMTCLNIGCPLGMGIWEGVPLREVVWLTQPKENLRRLFYYGYHNDDPKQIFQSSLPIDRVLEDQHQLPPVILCYKLNGEWLDSKRGGPVRVVVPEGYGFKSVKWITHIVLTNLFHANDTYASGNNDVESALKSFAATIHVPTVVAPGAPIPVTGYAQVGIAGVSRVQVWLERADRKWSKDDPNSTNAPWTDAQILPAPMKWGGRLPGDQIPSGTMGFDPGSLRPLSWPMRLGKAYWAALLNGVPAGEYVLRSRTIDTNGHAQPMPRPFRKSGHCAIEAVKILVKA